MTYIDKYMELHPDKNATQVMVASCPNEKFDIPSEPDTYCAMKHLTGGLDDCKICWRRTYRGEKEIEV